jgi:4-amino-4-deoxy-L-arabinose transferase-like glycosyltransferase
VRGSYLCFLGDAISLNCDNEIAGVKLQKAFFVLPAILTLILSICFWQNMRATDDLGYAQTSVSLLSGQQLSISSHQPNHHDARIGVTFPLAIVFFFFGVKDLSIALLPLLCTVLTAPLVVWLAGRFWGGAAGLIAGLLYALFPLTINLATFCVPEPILTFEICLACVLFLSAIERQGRSAGYIQFLVGVIIGLSYLTTEVGALMLPVFFLYLFFTRKICLRDTWLLAGFVIVFCLELSYQAALHGNPLYRFMLARIYSDDPGVRAANSNLAYRLLKSYPSMFIRPNLDFGVFGPLLIMSGFYGLFKLRKSSFFVIWAAIVLLFYNFMSASLSHYVALPTATRLLAPACVPLLVLSGKLLVDLWNWAACSSAVIVRYLTRVLYAAGAIGLAFVSLSFMFLNTSLGGFTSLVARNAKVAAGFLQEQSSVTLISDLTSAEAIEFYRHFNPQDSFLGFEAASRFLSSQLGQDFKKPVFVVLNGPIIHEQEITGQFYGGNLTLSPSDRDSLPLFFPSPEVEVFSADSQRGHLLATLLRHPFVRHALGPSEDRLAEVFLAEKPELTQVQAFYYNKNQRHEKKFSAQEGEFN